MPCTAVRGGTPSASSLLPAGDRIQYLSLTADDFARYSREDDDEEPLGDALAVLALDIDTDAVAEVRDVRERT